MTTSRSPKISVKQLNPFHSHQNGFRATFNNNSHVFHQYPPTHIESETSQSFDPTLRHSYIDQSRQNRQRRRKIFQRKILKATVIPLNYQTKNTQYFTTSYRNNIEKYNNGRQRQNYRDAEIVEENIINNKNQCEQSKRRNQQIAMIESKPPLETFAFENNRKNENYTNMSEKQKNENANYENNYHIDDRKQANKDQLPSFAKSEYYTVNQADQKWKEHQQIIRQLNCLPQEINKLKLDVLAQKQQINEVNRKMGSSSKENHKKEKQLLKNLIQKQEQLVRNKEELNQTLRAMSKAKAESEKRYESLLKYQLQMQRSKRLQQLARENQKLQQQIMKNNISRATRDTYNTIIDVTPLSHPVNVQSYFRDGQKDISALQSPYKAEDNFIDYEEYDNTLRDLLSPLQIKPDGDF